MSDFNSENRKVWDLYAAAAIPVANKISASTPEQIAKLAAEIADALLDVRTQKIEAYDKQASESMAAAWDAVRDQ